MTNQLIDQPAKQIWKDLGQRHRIRVPLKSLIYDDYGFWNKKLHLQYKFQDREIGILWRLTTMDSGVFFCSSSSIISALMAVG
jgi:hypothetical protein